VCVGFEGAERAKGGDADDSEEEGCWLVGRYWQLLTPPKLYLESAQATGTQTAPWGQLHEEVC
jgi:hypothetical protein